MKFVKAALAVDAIWVVLFLISLAFSWTYPKSLVATPAAMTLPGGGEALIDLHTENSVLTTKDLSVEAPSFIAYSVTAVVRKRIVTGTASEIGLLAILTASADAPPGRYQLRFFHPRTTYLTWPVRGPGLNVTVTIEVTK